MPLRPRSLEWILPVAIFLLVESGCGRQSPAPITSPAVESPIAGEATSPAGAGAMASVSTYPLAVGNRWLYACTMTLRSDPSHGDSLLYRGEWAKEAIIVRTDTLGGQSYFVIEETYRGPTETRGGAWLRQDRHGLHGIRIYNTIPFFPWPLPGVTGCMAIAQSAAAEQLVLQFPLHSGARWSTTTVEGRDVLATPAGRLPAWRLRTCDPETCERSGEVTWYGRGGKLGRRVYGIRLELPGDEPPDVIQAELTWNEILVRFQPAPG